MILLALIYIHTLSAAVLFGTGAGIAFFMVWANRTRDAATVAAVSRIVVTADFVFTATAVVVQPVTGAAMIAVQRWDPFQPWLVVAYGLFILTGACWLPALGLQIKMRNLAIEAALLGEPLSPAYHRLYRLWFALGWPAFAAVLAIYALMIAMPIWGTP